METNYRLPEVAELKKLGFNFEFKTINEFFDYIRKFINENDVALFKMLVPDFNSKEYESTVESKECDDNQIREIDARIRRLLKGRIETSDYRFVVHPVHKNEKFILIRAWDKRRLKFALETLHILYYPKAFGIEPFEAIQLTLLNELFRKLIRNISPGSFGDSSDNSQYLESRDSIGEWKRIQANHKGNDVSDGEKSFSMIDFIIDSEEDSMYKQMFENSITTFEKANKLIWRIHTHFNFYYPNQSTSVEDKKLVLRQFLKLQTPKILSSRNTRGRGIHEKKKSQIMEYAKLHPDKNISQIARALKVDRKTVRKYK